MSSTLPILESPLKVASSLNEPACVKRNVTSAWPALSVVAATISTPCGKVQLSAPL
jgi:hypothetical protein